MTIDRHREALRLMQAKDWPNALLQLDQALLARPGVPRLLLSKAQCLLALGRRAAACAAAAAAAAAAGSQDAGLLDAAGSLFSVAGDQRQALAAFERAVRLAPDNAHFIFNRATVRRFLGQLAAAEADYERVIALRPGDFEAYKNRADLRPQTAADNHVAQLEGLLARGFPDWRGEVQIRHALAKEYEDLGEYPKAFAQLRQGATLRRAHFDYDVARDVDTVNWIIEAFPQHAATMPPLARDAASVPPLAAAVAPPTDVPPSDNPVFIVGLPRSGTTLVERILGSHSQLRSAGELNDFALALVAAVRRDSGAASVARRDLVARSAQVDFAALGRDYLRRARAVAWDGRFVDKMPLNYLYCGLIHRALPHARIVHLTRHPMAVGYAMYKTLFKEGYPFSYDLGEIGRYYVAYRRLMDHWRAILPGVIHELAYEDLIADQKAQTQRLLHFCGLEWEEGCLAFHENPQASTTASASQVRRPLYASSLEQWRHYERELQPLRDVIAAAGLPEHAHRS